ncbi:hypothetical protein BRADI_5g12463v3 [Brachypodium distachyon]|uniref:Uncharacterized protein n=1 Tax=Brachypodium distachyon TaxID=15368 RepID=A0A0Q3E9D7_BRADI|nr:hypothetical protein BRADI_5g12463v3 [Brachypodium distachyon]
MLQGRSPTTDRGTCRRNSDHWLKSHGGSAAHLIARGRCLQWRRMTDALGKFGTSSMALKCRPRTERVGDAAGCSRAKDKEESR